MPKRDALVCVAHIVQALSTGMRAYDILQAEGQKEDFTVSLPPTVPRSTAERDFIFDEYKHVIENTAKLSDRRQTINDIFVGLNSLFLTAVVALLTYLINDLHLTTFIIKAS